jgi:hypothetical protein
VGGKNKAKRETEKKDNDKEIRETTKRKEPWGM